MKNLFLLILTLFLVSHNVSSQNTKFIDSLKLELESRKTDDSIKVSILAMLHEKLMFSKPEEAKKYAEQELEITSIFNVLPENVIKSKYRLKKKLKLDKDTDINTFLNDF
jgi:non-homologous end joining protein Ku